MSTIAIKAENISKAYQLGEFSTGALTQDIQRRWALFRGKEDPFLKIGETNDRTSKGSSNMVWSLKDISFEIKGGDAIGIIGRNGAGKSTLLKVLSRVTSPTTGSIKVKGRIASLLEVGTGFHPELTGRENIFLNGAILGMRKHEIVKHFDAIVDFAGVERYIDTPVKRYSSGMYVRLAFAVAAYLESEILIVDEVLAVGDAEFQRKCLGKMNDISQGEGRTVLFVSHNMDAVKELTSKSILLSQGQLHSYGETKEIISNYLSLGNKAKNHSQLVYNDSNWEVVKMSHLLREISFEYLEILDKNNTFFEEGDSIKIKVILRNNTSKDFKGLSIGLRAMNLEDKPVGTWFSKPTIFINKIDAKEVVFEIAKIDLAPNDYYFTIWIGQGDYMNYGVDFDSVDKIIFIKVLPRSGSEVLPYWDSNNWGDVIFKDLNLTNS